MLFVQEVNIVHFPGKGLQKIFRHQFDDPLQVVFDQFPGFFSFALRVKNKGQVPGRPAPVGNLDFNGAVLVKLETADADA